MLTFLALPGGSLFPAAASSQALPLSQNVDAASGYQYADRCDGDDIGAQIMSCASRLPTAAGYRVGTIVLPNTAGEPKEANWSSAVKLGPGVNLTGQGLFASSFHCTVSGPCLSYDASAASGIFAHSVLPNAVYQGFTITGNGATGQEILRLSDAQGLAVRDVAADGAKQAGGSCIHLEDVNWWTERNEFSNVSTLYGCSIGWRFTAAPGNRFQPHPSFGYNRFLDIKANTAGEQIAFSFEGNSYLYNSTFRVTVNKGDAGSVLFHMQDNAQYYLNETHITGEENGKGGYRLELGPGNLFTYYGEINLSVTPDKLAPGAVLTRYGDDAGYGPTGSTQFYGGLHWEQAAAIPDGADLNGYLQCGTFSGRRLIHAPPALGASFLRLEIICSGNKDYLTQIAYLMEYPASGLGTRVWQRLKENGAWGSWREMAWVDQLPLSGRTEPLGPQTLEAGACDQLMAKVPGAAIGMVVNVSPSSAEPLSPGLHWDKAFVSAGDTVTVPICNETGARIAVDRPLVFSIRVIP